MLKIVNYAASKKYLASIHYPLLFLDYGYHNEVFQPGIRVRQSHMASLSANVDLHSDSLGMGLISDFRWG
jgi:hypothetical protein